MAAHFLAAMAREPESRWRLEHADTGRVVADRLHPAFDSSSRRTGLLGRTAWPDGEALVIGPCQAVHTVGMRFPIDVLFVRRDGRVEKIRAKVPPWRMAGALKAFAVIELAAGAIDARVPGLSRDDRLVVTRAE